MSQVWDILENYYQCEYHDECKLTIYSQWSSALYNTTVKYLIVFISDVFVRKFEFSFVTLLSVSFYTEY